ncbi:MAG: cytochrome ubiquinol oxidase subunit I, partial [Geminicoccales bacterium]
MDLDPVLLARWQFAFVVSFHILFPAFTIGLAAWIAVLEGRWLWTGGTLYRNLSEFWTRIFAISFGMGVVSGIVMSFQFGTNWSTLSHRAGNIIGPLLNYEVLAAFFLEATFLGILLFGRGRVPRWLHFTSAVAVALGTLLSAFWILSANSWMQTPAGYELRDGIFYPTSWWEAVFNPSFPYRLAHMVTACFLTTAFVVAGVSAWHLLRDISTDHARVGLSMAMALIALLAPTQLVIGDLHGLNTQEHQPAKVAAMEAHWETQTGAPLILFAWPDMAAETNRYEVAIPKLGSLILQHDLDGQVHGLKEWPPEDRPY